MKKQIIILTIIFLASFMAYAQETYTIGNTEYYYGRTYETTGKPVVKRSEANKRAFLSKYGLTETPEGYEIDHIIPLSEGGTDDPSNMQLLTVEQHKLKTAEERANRSNSTYYPRTYTSSSTYVNQYNKPNSTTTAPSYSRTDSNGRIIYTGSRGGEYYINSSGNKVYVKSENSSTTTSNSSSNSTYYSPSTSTTTNKTIQTGPRGGKYYINSNGNKTYVKKKK